MSWPFAVIDVAAAPSDSYWLYFIMTIATAMATVGTRHQVRDGLRHRDPGHLRGDPGHAGRRGRSRVTQAVLDSVYAIILGGVITIITTILRNAATAVDRAQQTALERYSHAVRQHAIEAERVQVDAIVHDSVLTTFLSAARAFTPEAKELAATMAGNAIGHLRDAVAATPDSDASVRVARAGEPADGCGQHDVAAVLGRHRRRGPGVAARCRWRRRSTRRPCRAW